ncbi:hypothetical protein GE061_009467 [Apolygus lucorum]|uniref:Retrotransposon gag domain-containing protein n=1 Tax=Apolygus lucorum TaxID=248454 RepID=A0A8S9Y1K7_APOLU|nr:hypothetical protein GE061_009467 [Apolygus lucorum]
MDSHQSVADRVRQRRREHSVQDEEESIHNEDVAFADAGDQQPEQPQLPFLVNDLLRQFAEMTREFQSMRERELQRPGPTTREKIDVIHPPTYDGSTPWDEYWAQFRAIKTENDWGPTTAAVRLMAALRGSALAAVCNVPEDQRYLSTMEDALSRRFGAQGQARLFLARLRQRIQGASEDVASFAADVESLARRAMPSEEAREAVAVEQFLNGLRNQRVRELVISGDPTTLRDAMIRAAMLEAGLCSNRLQQVRSVAWDDDTSLEQNAFDIEMGPIPNMKIREGLLSQSEELLGNLLPQSVLFKEVSRQLMTNKTHNSTLMPQTLHWIMYDWLARTVNDHQLDWDFQLPTALLAYEESQHPVSGNTPPYCKFGRELTLPLGSIFGHQLDEKELSKFLVKLKKLLETSRLAARESHQLQAENVKIRCECKAWKLRFKQEDKVWLHNPKRLKRGSPQ